MITSKFYITSQFFTLHFHDHHVTILSQELQDINKVRAFTQ